MRRDVVRSQPLRSVWDTVDGVSIHARVSARELGKDRTPIVFVHGLGASTRYMEPTMALLAADHPVAGLDLPGFGRSGNPKHTLSLAELAQTLDRWLEVRGLPPGVFAGNSFGCQVIVECVTRDPRRAVGLVLNAPTMDPAHRTPFGQFLRVVADIPREPVSLAVHVARDYLRAGPIRLLQTLRTALDDRVEEKLPRIAIPVEVICGARDPVVTMEWAEQVTRLIGSEVPGAPGAKLAVLDHAAHALPYDDPETFAALILDLLQAVEAKV